MRPSAFLAVLLSAAAVHAQTTLVSNLSDNDNDDDTVSERLNGTTTAIYQEFTTGSSAATLASVTIDLPLGGSSIPNTVANFELQIYTANYENGVYAPGSLVTTLSGPGNPTHEENYTYTSGSSVSLSANTQYLIVASDSTSGTLSNSNYRLGTFDQGQSGPVTAASGWTLGDFEDAPGVNGVYDPNNITDYGNGMTLAVDVEGGLSAVPEPSTYALICGTAALVFAGWRRRSVIV